MRVGLLTAVFLLTSVIGSLAAVTVNMSPPAPAKIQAPAQTPAKAPVKPPVKVPPKVQAKVTCPCDCPKDHAVRHQHPRRTARHLFRHYAQRDYAESSYYRYSAAAPVIEHAWHGHWRVTPNDAYIPGPQGYGPPRHDNSQQDVQVDSRGWTGGVGDGGFVDGYGQVHFANSGAGPTYNSYGQSFQYNPSQARPFQPRSMGGYAPPRR